jgi:hypothetical protein
MLHGMEEIPLTAGFNFPAEVSKTLRKTTYYKWLYQNHVGHHVMSGRVNYNVCCPLFDHVVGPDRHCPPQTMPRHSMPCHGILRHTMLRHRMPRHMMPRNSPNAVSQYGAQT